jgi:uncharacterized membrane protein
MVIHLSEETIIEKNYSAFFKMIPGDLARVIVWLAASIVAIHLPFLNTTPVRFLLVLPLVLLIPGYCLITALFPKDGDLNLIERMALSLGLSLVIVPLIGLGLNFNPWGIWLDTIVISLVIFTLVLINIAYVRRIFHLYDARFRVPFIAIAGSIRKRIFPAESSRVDQLINVTLALVILVAIITTVYVITAPKAGERFTEFFILGENRTAAEYPGRIIAGQDYPMYIGVGNQENRDMAYTIETWIMRTEFDNVTNTSHIIAMEPNDHLSFTLTNNETTIIPYNLSLKKTGYDRVEFLLFNESVPGLDVTGSDRINASYRDLHLWVTVGEAEYEDLSI